ncbi:MAG: hypothetical protein ACI4SS_06375 [Clostridia bacterium]
MKFSECVDALRAIVTRPLQAAREIKFSDELRKKCQLILWLSLYVCTVIWIFYAGRSADTRIVAILFLFPTTFMVMKVWIFFESIIYRIGMKCFAKNNTSRGELACIVVPYYTVTYIVNWLILLIRLAVFSAVPGLSTALYIINIAANLLVQAWYWGNLYPVNKYRFRLEKKQNIMCVGFGAAVYLIWLVINFLI